MKKTLSSFLLLILFVFSVSAQKAQRAPKENQTEKNLKKHVGYLASDKLEGRRTGESGATSAAGYVLNQFAIYKLKAGFKNAKGKSVYLQPFAYQPRDAKGIVLTDAKALQAYNVVGILEGKDPVLKNEAIVIGAHYDHLGKGGMGSLAPNSQEIHHGADDNASGTSALIELARQFSQAKNNKRTIIFIAFGGEEEGLLGSKYYVNNPVFPIEKTVAMINMDMVGRLKENKLTVGGIGTATEWKGLVEKNVTEEPCETTTDNSICKSFALQLNEDGFGPSDHASFYGKKIPVLFFFTGTHLDYHKPSDTAEKINYVGLTAITNYVAEIVKNIDQNSVKPTYTVAKSSGNEAGRRGFNVSLGTIPSYSDSTNDGLAIDGARDGSPADKAGLKANDRIIKLAGIDIKNIQDYMKALNAMEAETEYEVIVMRGTEKLTLKIIPEGRK